MVGGEKTDLELDPMQIFADALLFSYEQGEIIMYKDFVQSNGRTVLE